MNILILLWCTVLQIVVFNDNGIYGITVSINKDITGLAGSNGTFIECIYDKIGVVRFNYVSIYAHRNNSFKQIVEFDPDLGTTSIKEDFLRGRVSLNSITQDSNKVMLSFDKLMCIDDTNYYCRVQYKSNNSDDSGSKTTSHTHIGVQVLPSRADLITFFKVFTLAMPLNQSSGFTQSTNGIPDLKEDDRVYIACNGDIGKPTIELVVQMIKTSGERVNIGTIENATKVISENCSFYQNSIFTVNLTADDNGAFFRCAPESLINEKDMYIETEPLYIEFQVRIPSIIVYIDQVNSSKTLTCRSIANPLPKYTWFKAAVRHDNPEQWKLIGNAQNITLTNVSDTGIYRCDVSNTVAGKRYLKSQTISIAFTVHQPEITKVPDQIIYTEGTPNVELTCLSTDYPSLIYRWILPNGTMINGNSYRIRHAEASQSGVYTCVLVYITSQGPTVSSVTEKIIIGDPETSTCLHKQTQNNNNVVAILGSVCGTLGLVLALGIIYMFRRSKMTEMLRSDHGLQMASGNSNNSTQNYEGISGERTYHYYDELRRRTEHP